jgi:hypothetical protein
MIEQVVLIGLAAWRLTALLSYERGPFNVFLHLRSLLGFVHDDDGRPDEWPDGVLQSVISCPWCLGLPMAAVAFGLWQVVPLAVIVLAVATVVVVVERWTND